ncbi:unnamed protein product [Leptidea sinapis]|uniref:Uncharacterized protein n=1 Tax=Leptidea sinapis TaxID=189913 RepID=A0A5E4PUN8_9NEOP|nr:unnamed protein product [Leptidea sinapis]
MFVWIVIGREWLDLINLESGTADSQMNKESREPKIHNGDTVVFRTGHFKPIHHLITTKCPLLRLSSEVLLLTGSLACKTTVEPCED